ncbi:hypothetical protein G7Y89_g15170 [Cudoniella acicularis]|uniref:Uncharacterized protein n=1 Tax=Cudoniella acicularis TaxID=354080 RepID=A0A8H4QSV3_9HELO|nr:hypothetical protein G7Y89_g15170 [Cudoniella acicularis]
MEDIFDDNTLNDTTATALLIEEPFYLPGDDYTSALHAPYPTTDWVSPPENASSPTAGPSPTISSISRATRRGLNPIYQLPNIFKIWQELVKLPWWDTTIKSSEEGKEDYSNLAHHFRQRHQSRKDTPRTLGISYKPRYLDIALPRIMELKAAGISNPEVTKAVKDEFLSEVSYKRIRNFVIQCPKHRTTTPLAHTNADGQTQPSPAVSQFTVPTPSNNHIPFSTPPSGMLAFGTPLDKTVLSNIPQSDMATTSVMFWGDGTEGLYGAAAAAQPPPAQLQALAALPTPKLYESFMDGQDDYLAMTSQSQGRFMPSSFGSHLEDHAMHDSVSSMPNGQTRSPNKGAVVSEITVPTPVHKIAGGLQTMSPSEAYPTPNQATEQNAVRRAAPFRDSIRVTKQRSLQQGHRVGSISWASRMGRALTTVDEKHSSNGPYHPAASPSVRHSNASNGNRYSISNDSGYGTEQEVLDDIVGRLSGLTILRRAMVHNNKGATFCSFDIQVTCRDFDV